MIGRMTGVDDMGPQGIGPGIRDCNDVRDKRLVQYGYAYTRKCNNSGVLLVYGHSNSIMSR